MRGELTGKGQAAGKVGLELGLKASVEFKGSERRGEGAIQEGQSK